METLQSDEQTVAAREAPMTHDEQVGNFALRELVNLNPQYGLADDPDHLEPGWVLDVTR
ncbi:LWXIA domain-containing protein [Cupriavidus pauculus]|uniref:LWXIA domain-containing protein n=1 Tax=Cupriavidus pauculus TaxID=82633 RepID=UPI002155301F|nr:LWXIA domain-containing protein [Cupriavidus pauculus]